MSLLICCFLARCGIQKTTFSIIDQTNDLSRDLMMTVFDLLVVFWPSIKYGEVQWTMDWVQTDRFSNRTMPHPMLGCAKAFLNCMYDTLFDMLKHVFNVNLWLLLLTKKDVFGKSDRKSDGNRQKSLLLFLRQVCEALKELHSSKVHFWNLTFFFELVFKFFP